MRRFAFEHHESRRDRAGPQWARGGGAIAAGSTPDRAADRSIDAGTTRGTHGRGQVAELHRRRWNGSETDRGVRGTRRPVQTFAPLKIFLARATRKTSARRSASERASLRPAEVSR